MSVLQSNLVLQLSLLSRPETDRNLKTADIKFVPDHLSMVSYRMVYAITNKLGS